MSELPQNGPRIASVEAIPVVDPGASVADKADELPSDRWRPHPLEALREPFSPRTFRDSGVLFGDPDAIGHVVVRVTTEDGIQGIGQVGLGWYEAVGIVERLAALVVGERIYDVERLWERMFRSTVNVGRKGLVVQAMSGIDVALWDLIGKVLDCPVYDLLGGRTHDRIRAYSTDIYPVADLSQLEREVKGKLEKGFTALKFPLGYGPTDGRAGIRANHNMVGTVRQTAGPDVELMIDAYMAWDVRYAIEMIRALEEFSLAWVEEPLVPDNLDGYAEVRRCVNTAISAGEHEFTRWGFLELIKHDAVDILQPDVNRMGGITEARKVWALASAHNMPVIPHGAHAHNAHLVAAHMNSPLLEYYTTDSFVGSAFYTELFSGEPVAICGYVELSERPGLGITVSEELLEAHRFRGVR